MQLTVLLFLYYLSLTAKLVIIIINQDAIQAIRKLQ